MLYAYSRNAAIVNALAMPGIHPLGEPRLDPRGGLWWQLTGERVAEIQEIVPSFSDIGSPGLVFRFVVRARSVDGQEGEVQLDWIGLPHSHSKDRVERGPLQLDIDTVKVSNPLSLLEIRVEFRGEIRPSIDAIVGISLRCSGAPSRSVDVYTEEELLVPPLSQFEQSASIGHRICSPTSVAMVLNYYGYSVSAVEVAERCYTGKHDLYGVWPNNIWAASTYGVPGCLMHIDSWDTVDHLFRLDIPLIASIRYRREELRGAAFSRDDGELTGHLVVVRGIRGDKVLVNDPGARLASDVARSYDRGEFSRVWFERSAMAYLLLPPKVLRSR